MSDIDFITALQKDFKNDCDLLGKLEIPEFDVSNNFKIKMKKLIKRQNKPYYRFVSTASRRAACIAVAILVFSVSSLSVKSVRKTLVSNFKFKGFSDHVNILNSSQEENHYPDTIETEYEITNIPDEFELVEYDKNQYEVFAYYTYKNYEIVFAQYLKSGYNIDLDNEHSKAYNYKDIDGQEYIIRESTDENYGSTFVWDNGEYIFYVFSNLDKSTVLNLCRSTKPK